MTALSPEVSLSRLGSSFCRSFCQDWNCGLPTCSSGWPREGCTVDCVEAYAFLDYTEVSIGLICLEPSSTGSGALLPFASPLSCLALWGKEGRVPLASLRRGWHESASSVSWKQKAKDCSRPCKCYTAYPGGEPSHGITTPRWPHRETDSHVLTM